MRVTFQKAECSDATVMSIQHGASFVPLTYDLVPKGCCPKIPKQIDLPEDATNPLLGEKLTEASTSPFFCCKAVGALISIGESLDQLHTQHLSAKAVFQHAKNTQVLVHLLLCLLGFAMFYTGFFMQFELVPALFRGVPVIGLWVETLGRFFAYLCAFICGTFCGSMTVGFSWLVLRPIKAVLLMGIAIAVVAVPVILINK